MEQIDILNQKGELISSLPLDPLVWKVSLSRWNFSLINRYYLANQRQGTKKTKSKGEVSGGGRKPWRQKGTGRARQGSIRSPQFRGGGTVFGPRGEENYSLSINKKFKKNIFRSLLGEKIRQKKIIVVDKLELVAYKTREAEKFLGVLPSQKDRSLIILGKNEENKKKLISAFRNLPYIEVTDSFTLSNWQTMPPNYLIFTHSAFIETEEKLCCR